MGRILRKSVRMGSLAKLMRTIGFDYKRCLLIEEICLSRWQRFFQAVWRAGSLSPPRSSVLDQPPHALGQIIDAERFGQQRHALGKEVGPHLRGPRVAGD